MGKRLTVRKELQKRLHESKQILSHQDTYSDLVSVLGGPYDPKVEEQFAINTKNDIAQIKFLLDCLDNEEFIKKVIYK